MFGVPTIRNDIKKKGLKSVGDINVFVILHLRTMVMNPMLFISSLPRSSAIWDSLLMTSKNLGLKMKLEISLKLLESSSLLPSSKLCIRKHSKIWAK